MTGQGHKNFNDEENEKKCKNDFLHLVEEWLQDLTTKEPKRGEWFQLHFEDSFPGFKRWVQQREAKGAREGNTNMDSKVA